MFDLARLNGVPFEAKGHCRIEYKDPITGKVLERIEGDNHVFTNQLQVRDFQSLITNAYLVLTDGTDSLDTSLPWIPGMPIGYGYVDSAATGLYQGAYRSSECYSNRITTGGASWLRVYDFLTTQIPRTIRYVGLQTSPGNGVSLPFTYKWSRNDYAGIYDVERKRVLYGGACSLSSTAGGSGSLYIYLLSNTPDATATKIDVFTTCGSPDNYWAITSGWQEHTRGYTAQWGYDYDNQRIVLKLTKYFWEMKYHDSSWHYTLKFRDDIWVLSLDGATAYQHFYYTWTAIEDANSSTSGWKGTSWQYYYHFWTGGAMANYCRLYGDILYGFASTPPDYGSASANVYYVYQYDITTGDITYETVNTGDSATHPMFGEDGTKITYMYKGYTWCSGGYYCYNNQFHGYASGKTAANPLYDVYTDTVYSYMPICEHVNYSGFVRRMLMEKGQTNIHSAVWNVKPYSNATEEVKTGTPIMPFAITAYQLPADAPVRPANSAVTIAYGLSITW